MTVETSGGLPPAPHPTAIMGDYKDHLYPVVGVAGNIAVIDRDGKRIRMPSRSGFQAARVDGFLPGELRVRDQSELSKQVTRTYRFTDGAEASGGIVSQGSVYNATLEASRAYTECYGALLFYSVGYLNGDTDDPRMAVAFFPVGDLAAGSETKIAADFAYVDFSKHAMYYLPLFFSQGREIRTNQEEALARLFRRVEMLRHERIVALYRQKHPGASLKAEPYLRFSPILPEHADMSAVPAVLRVDFAVTEDGTVEDVTTGAVVPPAIAYAVQRTLNGWLFMPKLVNGIPRRTMQALNIDFSGQGGGRGQAAPKSGS